MRAAAALLAGLLLASAAAAETVSLTDGSILKGRIVKADGATVTLETPDGLLELNKDRIKSIDYAPDPAAAAAAPAPAAVPAPANAPVPAEAAPWSAPAHRERRLRLFGSLELMTPGNVDRGLKDDIASTYRSAGLSGVANVDTSGALALRIGLRQDLDERFDLGFSLGFIGGPNTDVTATFSDGAGGTALVTDKREIGFVRFLAEPTVHYPLSRNSAFHLGAGLGVAHGHVDEKFTCAGVCPAATSESSSSWTGFTWEVAPYVSVDKLLLGFRWAGFPKFKGNAGNSKIDWTTGSIFAGIQF